ncbi:bile acid:sodium symporter family protein [Bacillus sp. z60-18]|uniref:bile acid:sodium symporter family protein n=1 Tax=Bacillus TaxID=1386 RepID=UPI000989B1FB|nr:MULTISPECIES: bile acid:sodium symporter family protein [Bacillus]WFA05480.1 bile acid:sodium symporter family protein [Bacillus sp. HSf4]
MLQTINQTLGKIMPLLTPVSVVSGVLLSAYLNGFADFVPWIFAFMTFAGSLAANFQSLKAAVIHPLPMLLALFVLHIFMPLLALATGHLVFHGDSLTITGLVLGVVIPTGITSMIWAAMHKGNVGLTLSIILIDTILSPFIVPFSLSVLAGAHVEMDVAGMMKGLFGMVVIPSLLGMLVNQFSDPEKTARLSANCAPFSKIGLALVVAINSSVVAPYLKSVDLRFLTIAVTVFLVAFTGYVTAWLLGRLLKRPQEEITALIFTGGMRNISAGAVLATSFFPAKVAVPVVIGMLFQQILAALFGQMLARSELKKSCHVDKKTSLPS